MKEDNLAILLQIIYFNKNINKLVRKGVSFKDITEITNKAVEIGYLTFENEKIKLTPIGIEFLLNYIETNKKTNKEEWIGIELKSKIPKIDKKFVFLPRQNELFF